jgi:hypothetical protein
VTALQTVGPIGNTVAAPVTAIPPATLGVNEIDATFGEIACDRREDELPVAVDLLGMKTEKLRVPGDCDTGLRIGADGVPAVTPVEPPPPHATKLMAKSVEAAKRYLLTCYPLHSQ